MPFTQPKKKTPSCGNQLKQEITNKTKNNKIRRNNHENNIKQTTVGNDWAEDGLEKANSKCNVYAN